MYSSFCVSMCDAVSIMYTHTRKSCNISINVHHTHTIVLRHESDMFYYQLT